MYYDNDDEYDKDWINPYDPDIENYDWGPDEPIVEQPIILSRKSSVSRSSSPRLSPTRSGSPRLSPHRLSPRILSSHRLSPNRLVSEIETRRGLIMEQDLEYKRALEEDIIREEKLNRLAFEKLKIDEIELLRLQQIENQLELIRNMAPPIYKYDITKYNHADLVILRFTLPTNQQMKTNQITHTFHKDEPLLTLIDQLKYDIRYLYDIVLNVAGRKVIMCDYSNTITECGIPNRSNIYVTHKLEEEEEEEEY
jgi:hypothetical protein